MACRHGFFLPVQVLSRLFRRLLCEKLRAAHGAGELQFFGEHAELAQPAVFANWLAPLRQGEWVVYAKRPFAGPAAVLAYLSRYTHRVAIANSRLITVDDHGVTFKWKDYRAKGRCRHGRMRLSVAEFMRRFLLHVLPQGFHRIRHYGLLANATRVENLARARALLETQPPPVLAIPDQTTDAPVVSAGPVDWHRCACCGATMVVIQTISRAHAPRVPLDSRGASP